MAANQNQVTLDIDLQLKEDALRDAKKQLDAVAQQYEQSFRQRQQALRAGGRLSPGFLLTDEDLKKSCANVRAAQQVFSKAQRDLEMHTAPFTKRIGGLYQRLLYGDKVGTPEDADKAHRRLEQRVGSFHRSLHATIAMSSHIARTLAPLPGGGVLHAGLAGLSSGVEEGRNEYEDKMRREGKAGTPAGRALYALGGGFKGALAGGGLTLLAKAVSGAVEGSREEENIFRQLTHAGGGTGMGRLGEGMAARARGLQAPEAAGVLGQVFGAGGGEGAAAAALRAQTGLGMGGQYAQLLGGLANVGVRGGQQAIDANAQRLWTDIIAAGYDKALGRIDPRKVAAGISGAMQMLGTQTLGTVSGDPAQIFRMQRFLGQSEAFTGGRGFEMMGKLQSFVKGESSPLARAVSLMQSGLGQQGVGMVEAMRRSEQGLFGEGGQKGVERVTDFVSRFSGMAGGDRDLTSLLMAKQGGMSVSAATELFDLVKSGKFSEKEFEEAKKAAIPLEQQAYEAMAGLNWAGINKTLESLNRLLGQLFEELGGFKAVLATLQTTMKALIELTKFVLEFKEKGAGEAINRFLERQGLTGDVHAGQALPADWRKVESGGQAAMWAMKGPQATAELREQEADMRRRAAMTGSQTGRAIYSTPQGLKFFFELRTDQGVVIERKEADANWHGVLPHLRGKGGVPQ